MRVYAAAVKRRTPCRVHSCMIEHALRAMQFRRRLALQEMGCCSYPFFLIIYLNFLSNQKKERCCLMNAAKNCKKRGRHRCAGAQKRAPARGIRTGERGIVVAPMPNFYDDNIYTKLSMYMQSVFCCCSRHNPHTCC